MTCFDDFRPNLKFGEKVKVCTYCPFFVNLSGKGLDVLKILGFFVLGVPGRACENKGQEGVRHGGLDLPGRFGTLRPESG
jgi:hypothetical protein